MFSEQTFASHCQQPSAAVAAGSYRGPCHRPEIQIKLAQAVVFPVLVVVPSPCAARNSQRLFHHHRRRRRYCCFAVACIAAKSALFKLGKQRCL